MLLTSIKENEPVWRQYREWARNEPCRERDTPTLERPCLADESFVWFVRDPAFEFKDHIGEVLHQMWEVETEFQRIKRGLPKEDQRPRRGQTPKFAPPHDGLVEFAEMTMRSLDWPSRHGRDLDPSSIPPRAHGLLKTFATLLPYQASVGTSGRPRPLGGSGTSYSVFDFGWQPAYHLSQRVMVQAPVSVTRWIAMREQGDSMPRTYFRGGLGIARKLGGFKVQSLGIAARPTLSRVWTRHRGFEWTPLDDFHRMLGYEATIQGLAGKARGTLYYTGSGLAKVQGSAWRVGVMAGITDIPGIVYWLVR